MKTQIAALALPLAWLCALIASSEAGTFSVCNRTPNRVQVAIAYYSLKETPIISEGWWTIDPEQCKRVFDNDDGSFDGHRYYTAQTVDGGAEWTGGFKYCVWFAHAFTYRHNKYYIKGSADCPSGWDALGFKGFPDRDLNLTE